MAKGKTGVAKKSKSAAPRLGPGLHLVHLDLGAADAPTVRTLDGRRIGAVVADGVDPGLLAECRRAGRTMIACDTERGVTIVGALQTAPSVEREPDGTLILEGTRVRIVAERGVSVEAGTGASMALESTGKARIAGDRMVLDMSSNVRVLSALVELP
ncbi:MAG TPA: hypothetical protein VE093_28080 [Polyangiaceae bacterium]|nr:hypothetical protein [Polyangiaceae bacterium]